jgi:hypothetical protein
MIILLYGIFIQILNIKIKKKNNIFKYINISYININNNRYMKFKILVNYNYKIRYHVYYLKIKFLNK